VILSQGFLACSPVMRLIVKPAGRLRGRFRVPADSELAQRAAVLSLLCSGKSTINNWDNAANAALECVRQLGATVVVDGLVVQIDGKTPAKLSPAESELDCQHSPTAFWLLAGLLCGQGFSSTLIGGDGTPPTIRTQVIEALARMGAQIDDSDAVSQTKIMPARLQGAEIKTSSVLPHLKSAVLLAGLLADAKTVITEDLPLPDSLERILPAYGIEPEITRPPRPRSRREEILSGGRTSDEPEKFHKRVTVTAPSLDLRPVDWVLPGDFSLAAPLIAACAAQPDSELLVEDVGLNPTRAGFLKVLKRMGAEITTHRRQMENNEPVGDVSVVGQVLKSTKITASEIPSLVAELPLLAVVAGAAVGVTVIRGVTELRDADILPLTKITDNLRRMGVKVAELEDGWAIEGPTEWRAAKIDCGGNAAVGMAFAIAGLFANEQTTIDNAECVTSRFPDFQKILLTLSKL